MAWTFLVIAGLFEIAWAIGLKYTQGFSRLWPSAFTIGCMIASVSLLGLAMRSIPVSTSYAVWTGIGAVGTVILGVVLFSDPVSPLRIVSVLLILLGIAGLKLAA